MSQRTLRGAFHTHLASPMRGRDAAELARGATPLELFFDLVVVVAVALAAERLHHAIVERVGLASLLSYALVFLAIWLAWVNFTWFASAYDTDDVVYRLGVLVIMTGALVLAAGVPLVFDQRDFRLVVTGYVIMRLALVTQWIRVAIDNAPRRGAALRFAVGVTACQVGWLSLVVVPQLWPLAWGVLLPIELLIPAWAERAARTPFHPEHITERYGLFMIIVLWRVGPGGVPRHTERPGNWRDYVRARGGDITAAFSSCIRCSGSISTGPRNTSSSPCRQPSLGAICTCRSSPRRRLLAPGLLSPLKSPPATTTLVGWRSARPSPPQSWCTCSACGRSMCVFSAPVPRAHPPARAASPHRRDLHPGTGACHWPAACRSGGGQGRVSGPRCGSCRDRRTGRVHQMGHMSIWAQKKGRRAHASRCRVPRDPQ